MTNYVDLSKTNSFGSITKRIMSVNGMGVLFALIVLCVFLGFTTDNFLTTANILVVLRQAVWVGIIAIGMTYVISTSGIDLSVGAVVGFCGLVTAVLIKSGLNLYLSLLIALIFGALFGLINGLIIAKVKVNAFIATMGMMSILHGLVYVYTKGIPIYGLGSPDFKFLAQGYIGGIPFPILLLVLLLAIFWYVLNFTKFGRHVLSIGSNEEAAKMVGINVDRVKIWVYVITGFLSAVSGILLTSRSEAAVVDAGNGYELDVIAAVIIGGTSLSGGRSNLMGAILGSILMVTIRNGLNLLHISSLWHQVVIGAVILIAVIADIISNRSRKE